MKLFNKKYRHFIKKIKAVEIGIVDLEFKQFKLGLEREEIREEFDGAKQRLESVQAQIKADKESPKLNVDELKRLDDDVVRLNIEIENKEKELREIDVEINGSPKTNDYPEGALGVVGQKELLREAIGQIKQYIKTL